MDVKSQKTRHERVIDSKKVSKIEENIDNTMASLKKKHKKKVQKMKNLILVNNRYKLNTKVYESEKAIIYAGEDTLTNHQVACKMAQLKSPHCKRLRHESNVLTKLQD